MAYYEGFKESWFCNNFEDNYMLFGYIGNREKFRKELETKSLFSKIIKILPKFKISATIKHLIDFEFTVNDGDNVFKKIYDTIEDAKNRKTITEHLKSIRKKGKASGRYFESIETYSWNKKKLTEVDPNMLEGKLITVEGNLIHRSSVAQYSTITSQQFSKANFEWILSDFPPNGLTEDNAEQFKGQVLILSEDEGFTQAFRDSLPFALPISWYPFVRVTGYYSASNLTINGYPSLSIVLTEYKPPKNLQGVLPDIKSFLRRELNNESYLENHENSKIFAYLIPILFQKANLTPAMADADLSNLLRQYKVALGTNMPKNLIPFYDNLP